MPVNNRDNPTPADHGSTIGSACQRRIQPQNPTQFLRNGKRVGQIKGYSTKSSLMKPSLGSMKSATPRNPSSQSLVHEPHAPIAAPDEIVSQYGALNDQAAIYGGTIDNTDRAIGRLIARLGAGELENTIIVYASDNGSYRPERNGEFAARKDLNSKAGTASRHLYWKGGISGGRVEDEPAGVVDLLPTLCGLIGIEKPAKVQLDGSDLAPLLTKSGKFKRHQPLWITGANMVLE